MKNPMTELPADDAPMSEWLRPISATMVNRRAITGCSSIEIGKYGSGRTGGVSKKALRRFEQILKDHRNA